MVSVSACARSHHSLTAAACSASVAPGMLPSAGDGDVVPLAGPRLVAGAEEGAEEQLGGAGRYG